jgi:flagellin-like protein
MRTITKIKSSIKAISPVISVLLMIAIAVAASLVAYAWVSGYMDFTTTKVGKSIQIQSVSENAVYVQNIGDANVEIADFYVDGNLEDWASISVEGTAGETLLTPGDTATIGVSTPLPRDNAPQVTIKVVTTDGISAEYTETFSGSLHFEGERCWQRFC